MAILRKASDRGHFDHGWLDTHHTFSFAGYRDPRHTGYRTLRVINEDRVKAGHGFGTHSHDNMEILSLVLSGSLKHEDSLGNGAVLRPGEVQYMSAGSGVRHSEFNPSSTEDVHFYQIWIEPDVRDAQPRYGQVKLSGESGWQTIATPAGEEGAIAIRQNAVVRYARVAGSTGLTVGPGRGLWLQVLSGTGTIAGAAVEAGTGVTIEEAGDHRFEGDGELLLFDLGPVTG